MRVLDYHVRDCAPNTNVMQAAGVITNVNTLAERLRWARSQKSMSQEELAKAAGVSQGTIGNAESGERKRPRDLLRIADALGVNPSWLETGRGLSSPSAADQGRAAFTRATEEFALAVAQNRVNEPVTSYGMAPVLAWEHEDDLPPGEFVMIPRLDVHLSAGGGRDQVEIELTKENPQAFRTEWIRLMRLKPNKLAAMRAAGDSMEPTLHDGDSLLVDTSQTEVSDGKVYALWYDGGERVKRLFRLPGGGLRIKSDNPEHGAIELGPEYVGHVRIIGRVVHRSGTGGL